MIEKAGGEELLPADVVSYEYMNTKNLRLRKATIRDVDDIFEIRRNPQLFRYLDHQIDETKEVTKSYLARMNKGQDDHKWIYWVVECKENRKAIGTICLNEINDEDSSAVVNFIMHPDYRGRGYMQETLDTVAMIAFDRLGLKKMIAVADAQDIESISLLENTDFQLLEVFEEKNPKTGKTIQLKKYVLINEYIFL